ncbi:MAG: PAS domain-containing protein [Lentisphaerae bacterium]|nr:PAS domain-containing protein [Lentisphaerota bacterium]
MAEAEGSAATQPAVKPTQTAATQPPTPAPSIKEQTRDRSLYKAVLASLYDAVIIVDHKGFIIASNGRAERFFGHSEADFWNLPCCNLITGFNPLVLGKIRAHVASGRFTVLNANCRRKDGSSFPAEIAISKIHY